MVSAEIQKPKTVGYGDFIAQLFLWQKAFLLVPVWGIALVPIFGYLCRALGGPAVQMGYGLVVCLCVAYFLEDLLKRKIRLDEQYIFFGFQAVPIKSISSVDVVYKKGRFLPGALLLTCDSGRKIKFGLGGLSEESVETILKHLQSCNSNLKTAAVLNTLVKCRSVNRRLPDKSDSLELAYNSHRFISDNIDVFLSTARKWVRVGPVLVCTLFVPLWISFTSSLFTCLQPYRYFHTANLNLNKFFSEFFGAIFGGIGYGLADASTAVQGFAANPLVFTLTGSALAFLGLYTLRVLWQPNHVITDKSGIKLVMRFRDLLIPVARADWNKIESIEFFKSNGSTGALRLSLSGKKKLDLDLSYLTPEDRGLLLSRLQRHIPDKHIDADLSQAMLPKSERSYTEIWLQSLNQPPERKSLDPLEPGQIVGEHRFEVLRSLGVGGQGTAYLCRDLAEQNELVLKETIIPVFAESSVRRKALEKFEKEASLLKSLNSPGIVKLLDYFVEDHRAYLLLEHIDGSNLRDRVAREGPLSEELVRELALQMCDILEFLHANSVVHRDFTPDNLILNSQGKLKLIDFNVAQQLKEGASGTIVGKHAYLPPEQFRGKADARADLYAFGATLFFLLTGSDPEPISQSSPLSFSSNFSESIDQVVRKATALQVNKRYQSAEEIETDLLADLSKPGELVELAATRAEVYGDG